MQHGAVKWYDDKKGYGFIKPELGERDIFVYASDIIGTDECVLKPGERVSFEIAETAHGPRAINVRRETV
ncbi:MAG: cold shock domain-containing protein [candidate division WOR-3 bacterium]|uniref:Cold shock domain-containing protein n=1 Tax=candidate division WOR-3 bacterium TaxID=2052148 RepID=A0A7C1NBZ8_UNCW3|nr:cold shock domain-containing protein [candidate division WOR-3 bacterium]